jgi:CheY-like chemotaxis protein/two-component sensor histidine kinase
MEAIGRLAGGIAHDFSNLLTAITGFSEMLLLDGRVGTESRGWVAEIRRSIDRGSSLVRQLLAFSRKRTPRLRSIDLNDLIRGIERMLGRLIGEHLALRTDFAEGLPTLRADPGQLELAIVNLAVNARDAMPGGGTLSIETSAVPGRDGRWIRLVIGDTGVGMDAHVRSHLFEPFFTTKEQGQGTGLGLATVYGIVRQSEGHIEVRSEPGRGTTFEILFPAGSGGSPTTGPREAPLVRGTETILLVEDVDGVRDLVRDMLTEWGYAVLEAANGQDAMERAARHDGPIHLLLTDVVMPKMGGLDLARQLAEARPGLRVLYMSGYADHAGLPVAPAAGTGFLPKPVEAGVLAHTVRELLDGPAPARP